VAIDDWACLDWIPYGEQLSPVHSTRLEAAASFVVHIMVLVVEINGRGDAWIPSVDIGQLKRRTYSYVNI
jgi:hypothetical protein